jgi:hypothetical protein
LARKTRSNFWELKIDGLLFVSRLISYLKVKEKEALNVLKGVNATNLNRKIKKAVTQSAEQQNLDMTTFVKDKVLGGFKLRLTDKAKDHQYYNFGHPYITGRGATKLITKSSIKTKRTWSISYKGMMNILMYGREGYNIPSPNKPRNSRIPMVWVNKPHYAKKSGKSGGCIAGGKSVWVPAYSGVDYAEAAETQIQAWMDDIQEKFLSKGFKP